MSSGIGQRMLTRQTFRIAAAFNETYGVQIERKVNLDKILLERKSARLIVRRQTVGHNVTQSNGLKSCMKIKKSTRKSVAFSFAPAVQQSITQPPAAEPILAPIAVPAIQAVDVVPSIQAVDDDPAAPAVDLIIADESIVPEIGSEVEI